MREQGWRLETTSGAGCARQHGQDDAQHLDRRGGAEEGWEKGGSWQRVGGMRRSDARLAILYYPRRRYRWAQPIWNR